MTRIISVKEYAIKNKITVQKVYRMIKAKEIKSKKIGSLTVVVE